jgi:hypothetical protein
MGSTEEIQRGEGGEASSEEDEMVLVASGAKPEPLKEMPLPYSPETSS